MPRYLRRPSCRPVMSQESRSTPCASPRRFLRRTVRILPCIRYLHTFQQMNTGTNKLTSDKQGVSCENHPLVPILHEIAHAILRMAGGVQGLDRDPFANLERLPVFRGRCDKHAIPAANNGEVPEFLALFAVSIQLAVFDEF